MNTNNEEMTLALAALRANNQWHIDYDDTGCYADSALQLQTQSAIDALVAAQANATARRTFDEAALANLIARHEGEAQQSICIRIEKMLCEKLGREWAPSGMSVASLIDDLARHAASVGVQQSDALELAHLRATEAA